MKIILNYNQEQNDFIVIEPGKRRFLHPKLEDIEFVHCDIVYNKVLKYFIVDYNDEYNTRSDIIYIKTLMTSDINYLIEILKDAK